MADKKTILVTGATGNHGRAVIKHLQASDHDFNLRGLTRDVAGDSAQELTDQGVEMVEGDLYDVSTLSDAFDGADYVFALTNFWVEGYDGQVEQGKNIADAAENAGVEYVVLAGVGNQQYADIPHFNSVQEISEYMQEKTFDLHVAQPVFFMENLAYLIEDNTLALPLYEDTDHVMTTYEDTGKAVAAAFESPEEFAGTAYNIASDRLTLTEIAEVISKVTGEEYQAYHVPIEDARDEFGEEFGMMCEWFADEGYASFDASSERVERVYGFKPTRFEEYLRNNGWEEYEEPNHVPGWIKAFEN